MCLILIMPEILEMIFPETEFLLTITTTGGSIMFTKNDSDIQMNIVLAIHTKVINIDHILIMLLPIIF
jgi:hypothetical protein